MTKRKSTKAKTAAEPKPKHTTVSVGQRLHIHVMKGAKQVAEYIAGADPEGAVRMNVAPEAAAPVQDPNPISGT